jgi:hypothetical protein
LKSIEFASPGDVQVKIDFGVAEIIRVVLEKMQFWGLQKRKLRAEVESQELNNEATALANANLKMEILRNAVKTVKEAQDDRLNNAIIGELKKLLPGLLDSQNLLKDAFSPGSPEIGILSERILPASADLVAGDDADFEADVTDDKE